MANMEVMKYLEPMDEVSLSEMNECAGYNESERTISLEIVDTRRPSIWIPCEGNISLRKVTETRKILRRGGSDNMHTRICYANGETLLLPVRNYRCKDQRYNCQSRKCGEQQRESDRQIVTKKLSNVSGVKLPYCKRIFLLKARQS